MIRREGEAKETVSVTETKPAAKPVRISTDNAVIGAAKNVLEKQAGVNVIEKTVLEKKHWVIMGCSVGAMVVLFLISFFVGMNRNRSLQALEREIGYYENQISLAETTKKTKEDLAEKQIAGLNTEQFAHDSDVIAEALSQMLIWDGGGMDAVRDSTRNTFEMSDENRVMTAFYGGSSYESSFDSVEVYCRKPDERMRSYGSVVSWTVITEEGEQIPKQALFLCSINQADELSALDVWTVETVPGLEIEE